MGAVGGEKDVVAQLQIVGQVVEIGVIGAGFQQEDRLVGVLGQAGGDSAAGRPGAHHDVVVSHGNLRGMDIRE